MGGPGAGVGQWCPLEPVLTCPVSPLQGLPGVPGKRGKMGRPVKVLRVYYAASGDPRPPCLLVPGPACFSLPPLPCSERWALSPVPRTLRGAASLAPGRLGTVLSP